MTALDLSKVDQLEKRRAIAADHIKRAELYDALQNARERFRPELSVLRERHFEEQRALSAKYAEEMGEIYKKRDEATQAENGALLAFDEAEESKHENGYYKDVAFNEDGEPRICCVSGLAIFDDDEVVDDSTGRAALACVLPWPSFEYVEVDTLSDKYAA